MIFFNGEEKMKAREVKTWSNLIFILELPFQTYIKQIITSTFDAWLFLLLHIRFTPSEGPKDFIN